MNEFPLPKFTLDVCPAHCIFLDDLKTFMNYTPPFYFDRKKIFPAQDLKPRKMTSLTFRFRQSGSYRVKRRPEK